MPRAISRQVQPVTQSHPRRGQNIHHIDPSHQSGRRPAAARLRTSSRSAARRSSARCFPARTPARCENPYHSTRDDSAVIAMTRRIVRIQHRPCRRRSIRRSEQQPLRRRVLFHGVVKIEMIAGQIGEYCGVKSDTVHPSQREGMGRNFHCKLRPAAAFQFGGEPHQVERFRRGVRRHAVSRPPDGIRWSRSAR